MITTRGSLLTGASPHDLVAGHGDLVDETDAARPGRGWQIGAGLPDGGLDDILVGAGYGDHLERDDLPGHRVGAAVDPGHAHPVDGADSLLDRERMHLHTAHVDDLRGAAEEVDAVVDELDQVAGRPPGVGVDRL